MTKQLARDVAKGLLCGKFPTMRAEEEWGMRMFWMREDVAFVCEALLAARGGAAWKLQAAGDMAECGLRTIAERAAACEV
jgi:hypothetical protein